MMLDQSMGDKKPKKDEEDKSLKMVDQSMGDKKPKKDKSLMMLLDQSMDGERIKPKEPKDKSLGDIVNE